MRTAHASAKLNLYLEILGRRADGFHELETLMVPVRLADSVNLTPTVSTVAEHLGAIRLQTHSSIPARLPGHRQSVPSGRDNLVVRALEVLRERSGCQLGARIELVKRVPAAAGLGGASSDAAAALQLANRAWRINWPLSRLQELAGEIGSDVPFFLIGKPAICRGRGERLEPLPAARSLHFVIVKPVADLSTDQVYANHSASASSPECPEACRLVQLTAALRAGRPYEVGRWLHNRLQAAAAALTPWVERLRAAFERLDFLGHQLTGSGTAYFGICRHRQHARRLAAMLQSQQFGLVYVTHS